MLVGEKVIGGTNTIVGYIQVTKKGNANLELEISRRIFFFFPHAGFSCGLNSLRDIQVKIPDLEGTFQSPPSSSLNTNPCSWAGMVAQW